MNANEQLSGTVGIKPVEGAVEEVKVLTTTLPRFLFNGDRGTYGLRPMPRVVRPSHPASRTWPG